MRFHREHADSIRKREVSRDRLQAESSHLATGSRESPPFPFSAVVGQEQAKRALLLLAIDPLLKGVLISSASGAGKSLLARSLKSILPDAGDGGGAKFIQVPLNVSEGRLLGELDLERTLATGRRHLLDGLLARAHSGLLFVDEINLLDERLAFHIAASLDSGILRIEREGLSEIHRTEFSLVGTYNPEEGPVSAVLQDRVGLHVSLSSHIDGDERAEIAERQSRFQKNPAVFNREFEVETSLIKSDIAVARVRLSGVRISAADLRRMALTALSLGVEGNRADLMTARAARANAALSGRDTVIEEDLLASIQFVLLPRATKRPVAAEPEDLEAQGSESEPVEALQSVQSESPDGVAIQDLIIKASDAQITSDVLGTAAGRSRRFASGKRTRADSATHGRYIRSTDRRTDPARVAIDATLRAAAPHQLSRRLEDRAGVKIRIDDLRFKRFKRRSGVLFIFVVDASGSMALNRMAQVKGAVARLLQNSYLHRDRVSLISFRGSTAEVLLPPTRSVALAKRALDAMPAGGATPLAAGLVKAYELARDARLREPSEIVLLLFTDGRANLGLRPRVENERTDGAGAIRTELREIGAVLEVARISSVVVDTKSRFVSAGEARELADLLGGRYFYLPHATEESIYRTATAAARARTAD